MTTIDAKKIALILLILLLLPEVSFGQDQPPDRRMVEVGGRTSCGGTNAAVT